MSSLSDIRESRCCDSSAFGVVLVALGLNVQLSKSKQALCKMQIQYSDLFAFHRKRKLVMNQTLARKANSKYKTLQCSILFCVCVVKYQVYV